MQLLPAPMHSNNNQSSQNTTSITQYQSQHRHLAPMPPSLKLTFGNRPLNLTDHTTNESSISNIGGYQLNGGYMKQEQQMNGGMNSNHPSVAAGAGTLCALMQMETDGNASNNMFPGQSGRLQLQEDPSFQKSFYSQQQRRNRKYSMSSTNSSPDIRPYTVLGRLRQDVGLGQYGKKSSKNGKGGRRRSNSKTFVDTYSDSGNGFRSMNGNNVSPTWVDLVPIVLYPLTYVSVKQIWVAHHMKIMVT